MRVVITGGTGFIGRKLAQRLLQRGAIAGPGGRETAIDELVLFDVAQPQPPIPPNNRPKRTTGSKSSPATSPIPPPYASSSTNRPAPSSISPPWSAARPRPTPISAIAS